MAAEAGKGDVPRKTQDDKKYAEGWDRIFGKNKQEKRADTQEKKVPALLKKEQKQ